MVGLAKSPLIVRFSDPTPAGEIATPSCPADLRVFCAQQKSAGRSPFGSTFGGFLGYRCGVFNFLFRQTRRNSCGRRYARCQSFGEHFLFRRRLTTPNYKATNITGNRMGNPTDGPTITNAVGKTANSSLRSYVRTFGGTWCVATFLWATGSPAFCKRGDASRTETITNGTTPTNGTPLLCYNCKKLRPVSKNKIR